VSRNKIRFFHGKIERPSRHQKQGQTLGCSLAHGPKSRGALALGGEECQQKNQQQKNLTGTQSGNGVWTSRAAETKNVSGACTATNQNEKYEARRRHRDNKKLAVKQADQDQNPPPVQEKEKFLGRANRV
jgi:hypothetical protein